MSPRVTSLPDMVRSSYSGLVIVGRPLYSPTGPLNTTRSPTFQRSAMYGMLNHETCNTPLPSLIVVVAPGGRM